MRARLTPAGRAWLAYALALAALVASCSGCASAPASCTVQLQGRAWRAEVGSQAWGLVDVRTAAPGFELVMVAPADLRCDQ